MLRNTPSVLLVYSLCNLAIHTPLLHTILCDLSKETYSDVRPCEIHLDLYFQDMNFYSLLIANSRY